MAIAVVISLMSDKIADTNRRTANPFLLEQSHIAPYCLHLKIICETSKVNIFTKYETKAV